MNEGDTCICQENDWYNAFGEATTVLHRGMRLTVIASKMVGGAKFYAFKETPKDHFFLGLGFKPMRTLN